MDILSSAPTSPRLQESQLVRDDCQFQVMFVVIHLIIFRAHTNISFTMIMLTIDPRLVNKCWSPISFKYIFFLCSHS